ncbi:hypothetical protein ELQ92_00910 [Labedella populi]|uniref:Polymerase nucleotidyl transferase domain-containing protein n=1 Tax=Labedella populi TaxID=2498850 RepID=A0A3S3ZYS9_9MICO|nr:nucleotidyltransferase domain-containing protein [Labedella populi]RWZ67863.1 hypothetical protein ELQ92_00910 [Labedella populi]
MIIVGSAALGDWKPGRSDVDLVMVVDRRLTSAELTIAAQVHAETKRSRPVDGIYFTEQQLIDGLLDVPAWELMTPGKAAQTVQVGAFPDAYDKWVPAGKTLVEKLSGSAAGGGGGACAAPGSSGEAM